jgi:hypothetical protein
MGLFLPVLAALAWALESRRMQFEIGWRVAVYSFFQIGLALTMLWHLGWLSAVQRFGELRGAF